MNLCQGSFCHCKYYNSIKVTFIFNDYLKTIEQKIATVTEESDWYLLWNTLVRHILSFITLLRLLMLYYHQKNNLSSETNRKSCSRLWLFMLFNHFIVQQIQGGFRNKKAYLFLHIQTYYQESPDGTKKQTKHINWNERFDSFQLNWKP